MFVLYYSPGSCSTAAHILLEECGADYQAKRVNLAAGEQRTEEYRKINIHGKVPALEIGDHIITQNAAILPFISGQFPESNFTPPDPIDYAKCVELVAWLASAVHPAFGLALHPALQPVRQLDLLHRDHEPRHQPGIAVDENARLAAAAARAGEHLERRAPGAPPGGSVAAPLRG